MENLIYTNFLTEIKQKIRLVQYETAKIVNKQMIFLYWEIGKSLSEKQKIEKWGKSIVESLAQDIQKEFPGIVGFSKTNLWYMKQFYQQYQDDEILQPMVGEISWTKHLVIMSKCKDQQERQFYILSTKKMGWTKNVLINKIELKAYEKFLLGQNNFQENLPEKIKNQAILALQDEFTWEFTELTDEHSEKELEEALVKNIRSFLIDFGTDFSFIGNQFKIELEDKEYFIDLLLYNRKMQCLIAIELKIGEFIPEYKGKMEFYLNILNDKVKLKHENPSIGIIICKSKNRTIVEYALKDTSQPIGIATYKISENLPEDYKNKLPDANKIKEKLLSIFDYK